MARRKPDAYHQMTDEEIIARLTRDEAVEILLKRYEGYLWQMARTRWEQTIGKEFVPLEDLVSAAKLGFIVAVREFNLSMGVKFLTYFVTVVNNHILKEIQNFMPLAFGNWGYKTAGEKEEITYVLKSIQSLNSHEDPHALDEDSPSLEEEIPDEAELEEQKRREIRWLLRNAVRHLPPAERQVITLIYGLRGGNPLSPKEVAKILGYTPKSVSVILNRATQRLKKILSEPLT
jgi:RNA polymerase sigma factor (sigma-70 family)